jgi:hypothetical protein
MGHDHPHSHVGYAARKHPEFVVLDIGDRAGGLIIHTDPEMHGTEIEISREQADDRRSHKQVLERSIGERPAFTAVFDGLAAGTYTLWVDGQPRVRGVSVEGDAVRVLDWRA